LSLPVRDPKAEITNEPAIASDSFGAGRPICSPEALDLFFTGTDGYVYHKWYTVERGWEPSAPDVNDWEQFKTCITGHAPAVGSWGRNRLDLFITRAVDGNLDHKWYDEGESPPPDEK
jgi:hypothetical protein